MKTRKVKNLTAVTILCLCLVGAVPPLSGCIGNAHDALYLMDWQRDLLAAGIGLLDLFEPPPSDTFAVWVEDFFGGDVGVFPFGEGGAVHLSEPVLGRLPLDPDNNVSYRFAIPANYNGLNPVSMNVYLLRQGQAVIGNMTLQFTVRRFVDGATTPETYASATLAVDAAADIGEVQVLTLPLNVAIPGGLGGGALNPGNLLHVEIEATASDEGEYLMMGVLVYDTLVVPAVSGGIIS
ncbi:MAG: hypothetical protein JSU68_09680 [Phycisphaerales bacterium]|nr:MAG: hypothetical protein JSU68_09680 [Phycisphaerales bacterium]